jgi:hypothetical protein
MGCKASKSAIEQEPHQQRGNRKSRKGAASSAVAGTSKTLESEKEGATLSTPSTPRPRSRASPKSTRSSSSHESISGVYHMIIQAQQCAIKQQQQQQQQEPAGSNSPARATNAGSSSSSSSAAAAALVDKIVQKCAKNPKLASYRHPTSGCTPLHQACRLLEESSCLQPGQVPGLVETLLSSFPEAASMPDQNGNTPLHYAIAPSDSGSSSASLSSSSASSHSPRQWRERAAVVTLLFMADLEASKSYLHRNGVRFEGSWTARCSPLYRAIEALPDDFDPRGPTVEFLSILRNAVDSIVVDIGNASDGDKPLALLYRRFTRQFDLAEKFFAGDNSRPSVVDHRHRYKTAAGNTWRIIELLLRPDNPKEKWRIVHRAVQVETPPDLLRYIVETNAEDLTVPDAGGNLPLHYAAKSKPPAGDTKTNYPAFYTKYVVDELLYKFPEAASMPNADGHFPLTLAVQAGKQWIGGGIKSLYDAYPQALKQIDLREHKSLRRVLSDFEEALLMSSGTSSSNPAAPVSPLSSSELSKEEKDDKGGIVTPEAAAVIRDEHHDAIMLVQQPDVDVSEVVASMWAHEEDAGVQMLGCVAISRIVKQARDVDAEILRISLSAVAGVVNAMKAHPNEVIVQEKACHALQLMARTDGKREVSFVASGAVAAVVGAMQAHVSDPGVQEEACGAVASILHHGGADRATIVGSVSGLTAILNAIAAHPDSVGVQKQGILSLRELTEEHQEDAYLPDLPRSQTEPLLQAAKKKFPKECEAAVDVVLSRLAAS